MHTVTIKIKTFRLLLAASASMFALAALPSTSSAFPYINPCIVATDCPSIVSGPADGAVIPQTNVTYGYTSNQEVYGFRCSMDGAAFGVCSGNDIFANSVQTSSYGSLAEGKHSFGVYELACAIPDVDCSGPDPSSPMTRNTVTFTVDHTPPVAGFNAGPADLQTITSTSTSFGFAATDATAVTFACSLDNAAASACSSPTTLSGLSAGPHKFVVTPTDAAGNQGTPITRAFAVSQAATPHRTVRKCHKVKVKRHGKVVRTKRGHIKYKKICHIVPAA
jgi:hypothetical protein